MKSNRRLAWAPVAGRIRIIASALALSAFGAQPALAGPTNATGTISYLFLSGAGNYSFRIGLKLNGVDQLTTCNSSFAFLNTSDSNYQAKTAALMSAYATRSTITLSSIYTDANGFCVIQDFWVSN